MVDVSGTAGEFADADVMTEMGQRIGADFNTAFQIMNEANVFRSYSNGKMNPQKNTTRAHLVALLHRLSDYIVGYWESKV